MAQPGRKPGTPKTGGRQAGTLNKVKRLSVATELERNKIDLIQEICTELKLLTGKDRVDILLKLLEYCAPKMRSTEVTIDDSGGSKDDELDKIPRHEIVRLLKGA